MDKTEHLITLEKIRISVVTGQVLVLIVSMFMVSCSSKEEKAKAIAMHYAEWKYSFADYEIAELRKEHGDDRGRTGWENDKKWVRDNLNVCAFGIMQMFSDKEIECLLDIPWSTLQNGIRDSVDKLDKYIERCVTHKRWREIYSY